MERSTQKSALINLLALLVVGATGLAVARATGSAAACLSTVFVGLGFLVTAVSWFQMRLEERERLERLEFDELARGKNASALFEAKDAEVFPAQRSREQFERFLVPVFTGLLFVAQGAGAFFLWRWLSRSGAATDVKRATVVLAAFGLVALVLFLLGKFSATIARLENHRLLRPGAGWLLLNAYLSFVVALGAVGVEAGFPKADHYVAFGLCVLLGLIAIETLVSLVLEIYRPRVKGRVARPLYESRVVGLLGQPEGLITTAAQALDYQFGFKVSETWFYRFFERALAWLLLLQLGALFLSTSVVFIELGEQGLLERFGKPVEGRTLLGPGAHLKWPWPIDRVHRYRTEQIQSFNVGYTPDPKLESQNTVLWTVPHANEQNFLVANREQIQLGTNEPSGKSAPPVSLLTVSIPVQFQITNLLDWAYQNETPSNLLQNLAEREVVRYLVGADLNEIMSRRQSDAAENLRERIQAGAVERKLGARILFVGLQDIHPPVKVAPEYEKVVGAGQTRQAKILDAQADDIKTNALARATAVSILASASADATSIEIGSLAQAALFTNQIPAYQAAPSVYMERSYLQMFARATAKARKYIVLTTNSQDVLQFDLQERIPNELLNLSVTPQKK